MTVTESIVEEQVVKSRSRVKSYGEVFTPRHMVDQMLDLVREELETGPDFVDKTFLEPAAGDGNFLVAILHRKLHAIEKRYPPRVWPDESLFALASIYGIELLEDNHRGREGGHARRVPELPRRPTASPVARSTNLHAGRGLPHRREHRPRQHPHGPGLAEGEEIQFSWWHRVDGKPGMVQREPFTLASLRERQQRFDFTVYDSYEAVPDRQGSRGVRADA